MLILILWLSIILCGVYLIPKAELILATPFVYTPETFDETGVAVSVFQDENIIIVRANVSDQGGAAISYVNISITDNDDILRAGPYAYMTKTADSCGADCDIYEFNYSLTWIYDNWNFLTQENLPTGITMNETYFWVTDRAVPDAVYRYNSTGDYNYWNFSTTDEDLIPQGVEFNGTYFWVLGNQYGYVYRYAYNPTYDNYTYDNWNFSVRDEIANAMDLAFNGTYFWITSLNDRKVYRYAHDPIYDNYTYDNFNFGVGTESTHPFGLDFDGTYFYVTGIGKDKVYRYDSNGDYTDYFFDVGGQDGSANGIVTNGNNFWMVGEGNNKVYRYTSTVPSGTWEIDVTAKDGNNEYAHNSTTFKIIGELWCEETNQGGANSDLTIKSGSVGAELGYAVLGDTTDGNRASAEDSWDDENWYFIMKNSTDSGTLKWVNVTFYHVNTNVNPNSDTFYIQCNNTGADPTDTDETKWATLWSGTVLPIAAKDFEFNLTEKCGVDTFEEINNTQFRITSVKSGGEDSVRWLIKAINITYAKVPPTDTTKPYFTNNATNTTVAGAIVNFSIEVNDETALSSCIPSTNNTGTWINASAMSISGAKDTCYNETTLNSTAGTLVSYKFYANDTSNNWNASDVYNLTTTSAGDSCDCSSIQAGTSIDCSENCDIDTCDAETQDIYISGTGSITVLGDVTNYGRLTIIGTDENNRCIVTCVSGCFRG